MICFPHYAIAQTSAPRSKNFRQKITNGSARKIQRVGQTKTEIHAVVALEIFAEFAFGFRKF